VMTYIAAIKNASAGFEAANNIQNQIEKEHLSKGNELYNAAMAQLTKTSSDGEDTIVNTVKDFKDSIATGDGSEPAYEIAKAEAMKTLDPIDGGFDKAQGLFREAKVEFDELNDKPMAENCEERAAVCDDKKKELRDKLEELLDEAIKDDRERRAYEHIVDTYGNVLKDNQDSLMDLIGVATDKIRKSTHNDQRVTIVEELDHNVDRLIEKMDKVGVLAVDTLDMLHSHERLEEVKQIKVDVDAYPGKIKQFVKEHISKALDDAGKNDQLSPAELLEVYHKFSVNVDTVGSRTQADDPGLSEDANAVRARLERIYGQMVALYETEKNLREKVQTEVDRVFDDESLLGEHWEKNGDRFTWVYPDDGSSRFLSIKKVGIDELKAEMAGNATLA